MRDMIEGTFDLINIQMNLKKLTKIIEFDDSLEEVQVLADKQRLSHVLVNLLSNALKFTMKGFIKIKVEKLDEQIAEIQEDKDPLINKD